MDQPAVCPYASWTGMLDELRAARLRGASAAERLRLIDRWRQRRCAACTCVCPHPMPEPPAVSHGHCAQPPR